MLRMPGTTLVDTFPVAELQEVFDEMFSSTRRVRPEELPMEVKVRHQASFSLSRRISIMGAMRS